MALPKQGRGLCVGMTGCGKSTLAERLIQDWLDTYGDKARVLIVDSKPRFRAELELDGRSARGRYKGWDYGAPFPGSVRLPLRHAESEIKHVWGGHMDVANPRRLRVAIAQGDLATLPWLSWAADRAYHVSHAKHETLVYYDELADFFSGSGLAARSDPALKIIRSGREKHVAFLGSTQRPKGIPKSALTELSNLYYFRTAYRDDTDHLQEMGFPEPIDTDLLYRQPHSFYFYSHVDPRTRGYYRLDMQEDRR